MEDNISEETCFDISMVVDDGAPAYTAPAEASEVENFKEVCKNCPNHRFD